jgi:soluble lytic murein transglycosylase-like protein
MPRLGFHFYYQLAGILVLTSTLSLAQAAPPDPQLRSRLLDAISSSHSFTDRFDAEVWLTDMSNRLHSKIPDSNQRLEFLRLVHTEATKAGLQPELVLAVIEVESDFNHWAISSSGAQGLMQVMPFWLEEIGHPADNLLQPATNLRLGCTILKYYLELEQGRLRPALARYNGSSGKRQYPDKVFTALSNRWYRQ